MDLRVDLGHEYGLVTTDKDICVDVKEIVLIIWDFRIHNIFFLVLQRERKRHTDRCLSSTPCAVLTWPGKGISSTPGRGIPPVLNWLVGGGGAGYTKLEYPHSDLAEMGSPHPDLAGWGPQLGHPHPDLAGWGGVVGVPPRWDPSHLDLAWVPPPPRCGQTENITFPHPSDAVGNKGSISPVEYFKGGLQ